MMNFEKILKKTKEEPDEDSKMTRRNFLKLSAKVAAAVAVNGSVPEMVLAKQTQNNENGNEGFETNFYQMTEELNTATTLFLEGKRVSLQGIKSKMNKLNEGYNSKYSNYEDLIDAVASESGFSIDQPVFT